MNRKTTLKKRFVTRTVATFVTGPILLSTVAFAEKKLTREDLLRGAPVPEKREFPLSTQIKPCTDFYKYVCGPTLETFELPKNRSKWTFAFTDSEERLLHVRNQYLKALQKFEPQSKRGQSVRDFYLGCMNEACSAQEEKQIVAAEIKKIQSLKTREAFVDYVSSQIDQPQFSFVGYFAIADQDDPNRSALMLVADATTLPEKSYYTQPENLKALEAVVTEFFKAIGMSNPQQRAKNVVQFESEYAKKDLEPAEYRVRFASKNTVTREELLKRYPNFKLSSFFKKIPDKLAIRAIAPETLEAIESSFKNTPLEVLKDAYLFHQLKGYLDDGYPGFFKKWFQFQHEILGGPETRRPREERCAQEINHKFGKELDTELTEILFPGFPAENVEKLVSQIRSTLVEELKDNQWLTSAGKAEAIKKIQNAKLYTVKPKTEKEWDYNPIGKYSKNTPYANRIQLRKLLIEKEMKELFEPRNREAWHMGPLTVNAYYVPTDNKFTLLQGILQYPFYDPKLSDIENLAGMGTVTGHELGHSIDDQGSKYDSEGKFRAWMSEKDLEAFRARTAKFVDQFNHVGHNGKLTLGENIGDHVGLTTAYRAAFGKKGTEEPAQKNVEDKRKFFISYARNWCEKMLPKFEEQMLKTNPHALGPARVNQQVVHLDGFYEAFACQKDDPMYLDPKDRIKVW